eukprot:g62323.t1
MGSNQKGGEEKEQEEGQSSSEINEEGKGVAESHEINLQECAEISNDSIAPMALLTQFRPSCALPLHEFEVSVYDPDNNSSFLFILNYLSCTCCRAETLFSFGILASVTNKPYVCSAHLCNEKIIQVEISRIIRG